MCDKWPAAKGLRGQHSLLCLLGSHFRQSLNLVLPPFLWSAVESMQSLNLIVCPHFCGQRPFLWLEISGTVPWLAWWYNSPNLPTRQWGHFCGRQWSRNFWNGPSAQ